MRQYTYSQLLVEVGVITQHLAGLVLFCAVFSLLYVQAIDHRALLTINLLLGGCLVAFSCAWRVSFDCADAARGSHPSLVIKNILVFAMILAGLSPILKTLTEDTSSDTIWALTSGLFFVNCVFHRYHEQK